jgi:hypothetical protein
MGNSHETNADEAEGKAKRVEVEVEVETVIAQLI